MDYKVLVSGILTWYSFNQNLCGFVIIEEMLKRMKFNSFLNTSVTNISTSNFAYSKCLITRAIFMT